MEKRNDWAMLRYSYYSSGRNELLLGNFDAAGILLGYAVETSFKHALLESGYDNKAILHSHDIRKLRSACKGTLALPHLEVSDDFLDYINDHFKPRYPSLKDQVIKGVEARSGFLTFGPLLLSWYDDVMFQIDNWIYEYTGDVLASCFFRATADLLNLKGALFFHGNYHACKYLTELKSMCEQHGRDDYVIKELSKKVEDFWERTKTLGVLPVQDYANIKYEKNFSKRFFYPTWNKENSITLSNWSHLMINLLPWEDPSPHK